MQAFLKKKGEPVEEELITTAGAERLEVGKVALVGATLVRATEATDATEESEFW